MTAKSRLQKNGYYVEFQGLNALRVYSDGHTTPATQEEIQELAESVYKSPINRTPAGKMDYILRTTSPLDMLKDDANYLRGDTKPDPDTKPPVSRIAMLGVGVLIASVLFFSSRNPFHKKARS